jgi:hypothetical protein
VGVGIESTTEDDCERLRDATDLIEESERETMPCVCEEDAIIIIVLADRTRKISLISSFSVSLDCLWSLDARAHVYNKQDSMYVSKMCVCGEKKKREKKLSLFLYRDRMSMLEAKMDCMCVCEKEENNIYL